MHINRKNTVTIVHVYTGCKIIFYKINCRWMIIKRTNFAQVDQLFYLPLEYRTWQYLTFLWDNEQASP